MISGSGINMWFEDQLKQVRIQPNTPSIINNKVAMFRYILNVLFLINDHTMGVTER